MPRATGFTSCAPRPDQHPRQIAHLKADIGNGADLPETAHGRRPRGIKPGRGPPPHVDHRAMGRHRDAGAGKAVLRRPGRDQPGQQRAPRHAAITALSATVDQVARRDRLRPAGGAVADIDRASCAAIRQQASRHHKQPALCLRRAHPRMHLGRQAVVVRVPQRGRTWRSKRRFSAPEKPGQIGCVRGRNSSIACRRSCPARQMRRRPATAALGAPCGLPVPPVQDMVGIVGPRAHPRRRDVQQTAGMIGRTGDAAARRRGVENRDPHPRGPLQAHRHRHGAGPAADDRKRSTRTPIYNGRA